MIRMLSGNGHRGRLFAYLTLPPGGKSRMMEKTEGKDKKVRQTAAVPTGSIDSVLTST